MVDGSDADVNAIIEADLRAIIDAQEERIADLLAEIDGLRQAMASRATIEQAKGIIMATTRCTPDAAFAVLVAQSQHQNRKLRHVAEDLVSSQDCGGAEDDPTCHGGAVPAADGSGGSVPTERTFGS